MKRSTTLGKTAGDPEGLRSLRPGQRAVSRKQLAVRGVWLYAGVSCDAFEAEYPWPVYTGGDDTSTPLVREASFLDDGRGACARRESRPRPAQQAAGQILIGAP